MELLIDNAGTIYQPVVKDDITLTLARKGQAGKLTFSVLKDGVIDFQEGNPVRLTVDGVALFYGFVFTKKRDKAGVIEVTAYDQMRYLLRNRDTMSLRGVTATELIQMIAGDYRLQTGSIADTGYVIESIKESDATLMDIIQNALGETLVNTRKLYVLYDDFGKLTLRNVEEMKLDLLIDEDTGENYDYESSIDRQTYTVINLSYDDEEAGIRQRFTESDSGRINDWGMLSYHEALKTPLGASEKAKALLALYNQKTRSLTIKSALGDLRVRAGSSLAVVLNLGDLLVQQYMMVNSVKHSLKADEHLMDLVLIGGESIA